MNDELLDIVNESDQVIGQQRRSEVYNQKMSNFRVVNAFVQNDNGQFWIPRRSKDKRIFPLCLDASMGGHVEAGESYEDALKRELMEELRIDTCKVSYKEVGILTPHQHNVSAFMKVFLIYSNESPDYNKNDFVEYFWLKPQEILTCLLQGDKSKDDLPKIIKHLFYRD
jgi:isopentenyl-diphosphate delta-isomerase